MGRYLTIVAALALCTAGCKNRPTPLDPFLGRTQVPPPPTGGINQTAPGALNYPAAPPSFSQPPSGSIYAPPGGFTPNTSSGTSTAPPTSSPAAGPPARFTSGATSPPPSSGVSSGSIRIEEPPAGARASTTNRSGGYSSAPAGTIDILDLPVSGRGAQPRTAEGTGRAVPQNYVSATPPISGIDAAAARNSTLPGQEPAYGFDAAYTQLNGRLEFSPADGRWFVRYIIPGQTPDRLGGVAVLSTAGPVTGLRNGDMVSVRGRLATDGGGASLPVFTASSVTLQRDRG